MNIIYKTDSYITYKLYNMNGNMYYLCVPSTVRYAYQMYIGLPQIDVSNSEDNEVIEKEIKRVCDSLYAINGDSLYILPDIPQKEISEASQDNDYKLYTIMYNKINACGTHACNMLNTIGVKNIYSKVKYIKQRDEDIKFIDWIEFNHIGEGIDLNEQTSGRSNTGSDTNTNESTITLPKKKTKKPSGGFSSMSYIIVIIALFVGLCISFLLFTK